MKNVSIVAVASVSMVLMTLGCSSAQKQMPHMGIGGLGMDLRLEREDFVVLDTVEGSSTHLSVFFGLFQVIDEDNVRLFGISLFKDKYTYFKAPGWFSGPKAEDRAYYKALEKQPDADIVIAKSLDRDTWGIPKFFSKSSATFRGKALRIKADH